MHSSSDKVRFDGPEVRTIASQLSDSAAAADEQCRPTLNLLAFGPDSVGVRYRARGAEIEAGYRVLRRAVERWSATTNRHADDLVCAADTYQDNDDRVREAIRSVLGEWTR